MARLHRDAYGVPHVRATSLHDLAHGQGLVTARDRSWQLEHLRRRATGTTAELLGPAGLAWDRLARRTALADVARRAHAGLEPATRDFVAAYVAGLNEGLRADVPELEQLGATPVAWEPWTPLAVMAAQHLLFGSLPGKLWAHRAREVLGDEARLLSHEGPVTSGSNAWVVGGDRTASGFPLVAGDPHRAFESPGVYMQVRLACEDPDDRFDVAGFAFPGVPGVQHFAHAGDVAWAITNAMADTQDVYAEQLRRAADGTVEALGPGGWEPADSRVGTITVRDAEDVRVEVIATHRGRVLAGDLAAEPGSTVDALSLRTPTDVLGDLGFDALLPLLRARSVDDVDAAFDGWVEPVNNVVAADRDGTVRYRVAGRVPLRAEANRRGIVDAADPAHGWTGWVDPLPRADVPADGHVVTANERRGPESAAIGTTFAPPHRAARIAALLEGRDDLTADDLAAVHADALLPALALYRDLLRPLSPGPAGERVRDLLLAWDGRMEADSAGAAAFAAWRGALVRRVAAEPVLAPLAEPVVDDPVLAPWLHPTARVGVAVENLVAAGRPFGIDLAALATQALDDAAGHAATWGATHTFFAAHAFHGAPQGPDGPRPPHVPAYAVGGDTDCVRCTGSLPGVDDAAWRGSVARYVWDLADRGRSGWVVPLGAAADPRSPHHADQLPHWAAVRLLPLVTDWDRLTEETP